MLLPSANLRRAFFCWCWVGWVGWVGWKIRVVKGVNPSSRAFPPSRLGKVCKHPLLSAWRRLEALRALGVISVVQSNNYKKLLHSYSLLIAPTYRYLPLPFGAKIKSFPPSVFRFTFFRIFAPSKSVFYESLQIWRCFGASRRGCKKSPQHCS